MTSEQKSRQREYADMLVSYYNKNQNTPSTKARQGELVHRYASIHDCISQVVMYASPYFDPPIATSRKGIAGRAVIITKKAIRKLTRFLFVPQMEKNYQFQIKTVEALKMITDSIGNSNNRIQLNPPSQNDINRDFNHENFPRKLNVGCGFDTKKIF